jgi:hypothetical protein
VLLHNESGAFGLVLNRATDVSPIDAVPMWAEVTGPTVRHGGPVETDALIAIGRMVGLTEPSGYRAIETPTLGSIGLVDLHGQPNDAVRDVTLFAGYTGWVNSTAKCSWGVGSSCPLRLAIRSIPASTACGAAFCVEQTEPIRPFDSFPTTSP